MSFASHEALGPSYQCFTGLIYEHAKSLGITLITISHRPSLLKYHNYQLHLTGEQGRWELTKIASEEERHKETQAEVEDIKSRLQGIESTKARLAEVNHELGFVR